MQNGNVIEFGVQAKDLFSDTLKKFESAVGATTGKIAIAGAAYAGLALAAFKLADSVATAADEQKLLAERAGMAVKEFGLLQKSLGLANVEQGQFTAAMRNLNLALSAATKEDQAFVKALKAVGVNVRDNNQVFKFMIKALGDIEDETERTRIGTIAFGRSYESLKSAIEAGTDALEENAQFAERVGVVFDKVTSGAADDFKDGMEKIGMVLSGVSNKAVGPLLPELAEMANRFAEFASKSNITSVAVAVLRGTLDALIKSVRVVGSVFAVVGEVMALAFNSVLIIIGGTAKALVQLFNLEFDAAGQTVKDTFTGLGIAVDEANDALDTLLNSAPENADANNETAKSASQLAAEYEKAANAARLKEEREKAQKKATEESAKQESERTKTVASYVLELENEIAKLEGSEQATQKKTAAVIAATPAQRKLITELEKTRDELERNSVHADVLRRGKEALANAVSFAKDKTSEFRDKQLLINNALEHGALKADEAALATRNLNAEVAAYNADLDRLDAKGAGFWDTFIAQMDASRSSMHSWSVSFGKMLSDAAEGAIEGIGDALADLIINGGDWDEAFKQLGKRIAEKLLSDIITDAIKRAIFDIPTAAGVGVAQGTAANATMMGSAVAIGTAIGTAAAGAMGAGGAAAGAGAAAGGAAAGAGAAGGAAAGAGAAGAAGGAAAGAGGAAAGASAASVAAGAGIMAAFIALFETQAGEEVIDAAMKGGSEAAEATEKLVNPIFNAFGFGGGRSAEEIAIATGTPGLTPIGYERTDIEYTGPEGSGMVFKNMRWNGSGWDVSYSDPMAGITQQDYTNVAHGGMSYVPKESTYYLDKGERVLSPKQNTDLTTFLEQTKQGGPMGNVTVNATIHIMENATSIDQFAQLDQATLRDKLGRPIIEALNGMWNSGIAPEFAR